MPENPIDELFTPEALELLREMARTHDLAPVVAEFMASGPSEVGGLSGGLITAGEVREAFRGLVDMGFVETGGTP